MIRGEGPFHCTPVIRV
uniref:Uncharacterized protein n=1 Tax=Anguilla anguilla TaxID=7936 RepID=A0A0E9VNR3_ANGAN